MRRRRGKMEGGRRRKEGFGGKEDGIKEEEGKLDKK